MKLKEREWLVQQGLTKPGSRGRLSIAAKTALEKAKSEGMTFDLVGLPKADKIAKKHKPKTPRAALTIDMRSDKVRVESVAWGIDKSSKPGTHDLLIAFSHCAGCGKCISRCTHDAPLLPNWLGGGEALLIKPDNF
jgi:ferredoxin